MQVGRISLIWHYVAAVAAVVVGALVTSDMAYSAEQAQSFVAFAAKLAAAY